MSWIATSLAIILRGGATASECDQCTFTAKLRFSFFRSAFLVFHLPDQLFCFSAFLLFAFCFLLFSFSAFQLFGFSAFQLFDFSAFQLFVFSAFWLFSFSAFLLFSFSACLLFCFSALPLFCLSPYLLSHQTALTRSPSVS